VFEKEYAWFLPADWGGVGKSGTGFGRTSRGWWGANFKKEIAIQGRGRDELPGTRNGLEGTTPGGETPPWDEKKIGFK